MTGKAVHEGDKQKQRPRIRFPSLPQEGRDAVNEIASELGETDIMARKQIAHVIFHEGVNGARALLKRTLEIEAQGGMLTGDNSRRRTPGGVFFYLARGLVIEKREEARARRAQEQANRPDFEWAERETHTSGLLEQRGEAVDVRVTLEGRPGKVKVFKDVVMTTFEHHPARFDNPDDLPSPPDEPVMYTVYMGPKQWRRVEDAVANSEDQLIVEGICAFDKEANMMAIYANKVTTQTMRDEANARAKAENTDKKPKSKAPVETKTQAPPLPPPEPMPEIPEGVPTDVADKLRELYSAAIQFRQKIAALEAKPANKRFGMEMTQKLLANTERQIAALEKRYAAE